MSVSRLVSRNIQAAGGRTSMRLEPEFWDALHEICRREARCFGEIVREVEAGRTEGGRTSAMRVSILQYFRDHVTDTGHPMAGHGQTAGLPYPF
jgi:predicted DNA-binding ribbon-helix-helix protein